MTTLFVTASGTDVGKTFVMLQLIAELRAAGRRVRALKPVASGFAEAQPDDSDTGRLLRAQGLPLDLVRDIANKVDRNEYKRQQAAPGLKVTTKAFGMGRRFPIAQRFFE